MKLLQIYQSTNSQMLPFTIAILAICILIAGAAWRYLKKTPLTHELNRIEAKQEAYNNLMDAAELMEEAWQKLYAIEGTKNINPYLNTLDEVRKEVLHAARFVSSQEHDEDPWIIPYGTYKGNLTAQSPIKK